MRDRRLGLTGSVLGRLLISGGDDMLTWRETGCLTWAGVQREVARRYQLRAEADGWWMAFDDGRPFHPWRLGEHVVHDCGEDTYRGLVQVPSPSLVHIVWAVTGPTKDQLLSSVHRRASSPVSSDATPRETLARSPAGCRESVTA